MKLSFRNGVALSSVRQACRARWTWYWGWTGLYASTHSRGTSRFLRWAKTQPLWQTVHLFWTSTHEYKWYAHCSLKTEKQFDLNPNQTSKRAMALMILCPLEKFVKQEICWHVRKAHKLHAILLTVVSVYSNPYLFQLKLLYGYQSCSNICTDKSEYSKLKTNRSVTVQVQSRKRRGFVQTKT